MPQKTAIPKKVWMLFCLFGMSGQIAWAVENMYFNMFIYDTIVKDTHAVTIMVQASGIMAAVATVLAGALSDKLGNRRLFISVGYMIWGVVIGLFAFVSRDNTALLMPAASLETVVGVTVTIVVVLDCVMTLFGSSANDAAFNAWVTDMTDSTNRGSVEGMLSTLPLIAMLLVAGGFGILVDLLGGYAPVFLLLGAIVFVCGIIGLLLLRDAKTLHRDEDAYFSNLFYGFRPAFIRENKVLYLLLIGVCLYSISCQIFFPYLIIYLEHYLGLSTIQYSLVLGISVILGAVVAAVCGKISDRINKTGFLFVALAVFAVGLALMYCSKFTTNTLALIAMSFVMISGYVLLLMLFNAEIRDYTPEHAAGKVQGVRIVFYVLLPMFIGPLIGDNVIRTAAAAAPQTYTYFDAASASTAYVPSPDIFLWSAAVSLLTALPLLALRKAQKTQAVR